jgi:hypothetical protein
MVARKRPWDQPEFTLIDRFTLAGIRAGQDFEKRIREFQWAFYAHLAQQRAEVRDRLHRALLEAAVDRFEFSKWQRLVKYRWTLKPLSSAGSLGFPGGRFNIGAVDPSFSTFPALYLSQELETAFQETLGQRSDAKGELSAFEIALTRRTSISLFSLSGKVHTVLDLRQPERLKPFVDIIKNFTISAELRRTSRVLAREMKMPVPKLLVTSVKELLSVLLMENWRELPIQVAVPSTSQLFGQLVVTAGIEAIVYPSKYDGLPCIAIFPEAFAISSSHVVLEGQPPRQDVVTRLDQSTWQKLSR